MTNASADKVGARFPNMRFATAAIDWFRNQAVAPEAIGIFAITPDHKIRPPQVGDNRRSDLQWIVSLDLARANLDKRVATEALRREGGALLKRLPEGM
jgi:hypothetical protein